MTQYFLGVDGGQSSTTAIVGDQHGNLLGWGTDGPCNHVARAAEGRTKFLRVIGNCIAQACRVANIARGLSTPEFEAACFGMSGGPDDKRELLTELLNTPHLEVTNDAMIALAGAHSGQPGIIVIAGTGSIAYGCNSQGEVARAGGWGYIFGDEGGSFDIARQALRAILREHEGWGPRTALTPALLAFAEAAEANDLLHRFYTADWPRHRVATLSKLVNEIAEQGDPAAQQILERAAQELATLASSVKHQIFNETDSIAVAYVGGAFQSELLRDRFRLLVELSGNTDCKAPDHSPAIGALYRAYRASGLSPILKNTSSLKT